MHDASVVIDSLAYGGAGFGRIEGKACFVPYTAPGDRVRVRIKRETASYAVAELVQAEELSPLRAAPPCPVFGRCGGCQWQHLEYGAQCRAKEQVFAEALWRMARVERGKILPIVAAADPWEYRTRVQLKLYGRGERFRIGFYAPASHYVIDMPERCIAAHPVINTAIRELRAVVEEFSERDRLPQIDMAVGSDSGCVITVHYLGSSPHDVVNFWRSRHEALPSITGICLQQGRKETILSVSGSTQTHYRVPGSVGGGEELTLGFSAGSFSQVNYRQNAALVQTALDWAGLSGTERVVDLCCGNGNFSLPFACGASETVGFDTGEQSVADARVNAGANGIGNARFDSLDGAAGLRQLIAEGARCDVAILDPPRSGAAEMAGLLPELGPQKVLYISCDPQTLGRDLARLCKGGYDVVQSRPVDMFPQTYHIESITLLEQM